MSKDQPVEKVSPMEMAAFDALPPLLRGAINYGLARHSPLEVYELYLRDYDEDRVLQVIVRTEVNMLQGNPDA